MPRKASPRGPSASIGGQDREGFCRRSLIAHSRVRVRWLLMLLVVVAFGKGLKLRRSKLETSTQ